MKIDILKNVLEIYKDKQPALLYYLPEKVKQLVSSCELYDKDFTSMYLNDKIFLIDKSNLLLETSGKVMSIDEDRVRLRINYKYIITYDISDYYVFIETTKQKRRDFYKSLLNNL